VSEKIRVVIHGIDYHASASRRRLTFVISRERHEGLLFPKKIIFAAE
jgi:hypothetical protein